MNIKRIVLLTVILMIAISSLSMVSAGWFDFLSGTTDINGVSFKIPDGFSLNNTTNESKSFVNNDEYLEIYVYSDHNMTLPEEGHYNQYTGTPTKNGTFLKIVSVTYKNTTINGYKGVWGKYGNYKYFSFDYINGTKYISIYSNNATVIKELLGEK